MSPLFSCVHKSSPLKSSSALWPAFCFGLAARWRLGSLHRPSALRLCFMLLGLPSALPLPRASIYRCPVSRLFYFCLVLPPGLPSLSASLFCLVAEVRDSQIYYLCSRVMQNRMVLGLVSFSSVSTIGLYYTKLVLANIDFACLYHMLVFDVFRGFQGYAKIIQTCRNDFRKDLRRPTSSKTSFEWPSQGFYYRFVIIFRTR